MANCMVHILYVAMHCMCSRCTYGCRAWRLDLSQSESIPYHKHKRWIPPWRNSCVTDTWNRSHQLPERGSNQSYRLQEGQRKGVSLVYVLTLTSEQTEKTSILRKSNDSKMGDSTHTKLRPVSYCLISIQLCGCNGKCFSASDVD